MGIDQDREEKRHSLEHQGKGSFLVLNHSQGQEAFSSTSQARERGRNESYRIELDEQTEGSHFRVKRGEH